MDKISVIMPVYNAGADLFQSVVSLCQQTYENMEIILVNDCSTDDSWLRMLALEQKFPDKIMAINCEENRGPGGARNIGLSYATGDYIGFCDSDDEAKRDMFELLHDKAVEGDYDMVDSAYYCKRDNEVVRLTQNDMTGELDDEKRSKLILGGGFLWSRLFKRSVLLDPLKPMREKCTLEDSDYLVSLFATMKSAGNIDKVVYYYDDLKDSASHPKDRAKSTEELKAAADGIYKCTKNLPNYKGIREAVEYRILELYDIAIEELLNEYLLNDKTTWDFTRHYLQDLRLWKLSIIPAGYNNQYLRPRLSERQILIMKDNDKSPEKLMNTIQVIPEDRKKVKEYRAAHGK